jgi:ATP-dependent Clp protease ATP-binding subunit ClpC
MFERFTERARRSLVIAQDEARTLQHGFIRPEHILLGLIRAEGLASTALRDAGVDLDAARAKVAKAIITAPSAGYVDKVPFSPQAKKVLELSLREALRLGHNYIGTEHILLGLLREADAKGNAVKDIVGGLAGQLRARVIELVQSAPLRPSPSPASKEAMDRARELAGQAVMTTGHLLTAILADAQSQASKALAALGITQEPLAAALAGTALDETSDAVPVPGAVEIRIGEITTTVQDPDLAAVLKGVTADEVRAALHKAFGTAGGDNAAPAQDTGPRDPGE